MLAGIIISSLRYISPSSYITHFMLGVVYYVTFTHLSYKLLLCLFIIMLWQKLFKICHCCVSYVTIMHPSYIALLGLLISTAWERWLSLDHNVIQCYLSSIRNIVKMSMI